jgi:hypothetical protein
MVKMLLGLRIPLEQGRHTVFSGGRFPRKERHQWSDESRLALIRWRKPEGGFKIEEEHEREGQKTMKVKLADLVCMTKEEAQKHERGGF